MSKIVKPALCLDFDGTIRRSKSGRTFIKDHTDIELMPDIERRIWSYRNSGYLVLGVSNQAGVAHGIKTVEQIELEMSATFNLFSKSPFHLARWCYFDGKGNTPPYNVRSLHRKPGTGMLARMETDAFEQFATVINWDASIFVGDRPEDEQCAQAAGIRFVHIDNFVHILEDVNK